MKKLLIIMNPHSGKKQANSKLTGIVNILNRGGYDVTVYMTASQGDATRVASARAHEFDTILCIGGDGTFNEVVSGLIDLEAKPNLAYIPAGSTNDFANSLNISKDIMQAARDVVEGTPCSLDIGRFNDRYFSYIASFGAFTKTSYATPQNLKNSLGHLAYVLAGVKEVAAIRTHHIRFTLADGTVHEDDYIFGAISNSTSVAGILTLAPHLVDMNDGMFELLLIRKPYNLLELSDCVLALMTQEYSTAMLTLVSTQSVQIEAPADMDWTLDGEHAGGAEHCSIVNIPNAVRVIINS